MKKKSVIYNHELDLINFFKILWKGKIKIFLIIIISFLMGYAYHFHKPNNYLYSLTIKQGESSELYNYFFLKNLIKINQINQINKINNLNDETIILNKFIRELKDKEELIFNLQKTKKIRENLKQIPLEARKKILFNYAKSLQIVKSEKNPTEFILYFSWDNANEANEIIRDTLDLTLINLEKSIYKNLEQQLRFLKEMTENNDMNRINYLTEQSSIAKDLEIEKNQIDNVELSQSSVSLTINNNDIAYYLRGYKAIDKEIELIEKRDYQNLIFIEEKINSFKKIDTKWINYNIYSSEQKLLKNANSILKISILSGLIIGVFYVLISSAIQSTTTLKKRHK
jgi:LPS O-antigen subunit length determinant protein (WzzB/FepE family)